MTNIARRSACLLVLLAVGAGALVPSSATAQSDEDLSGIIEEIVVTARKRSESIQDTPLSISAFGAEEIQAAGYENIIDVSKAAPGLFIEPINGNNARVVTTPRFRGVTFESTSPLQRTASIFIDGILVSGGIQSIDVANFERVEIIKGPQSALFGRNTFSGAINYVTRDPDEEFGAKISVLGATKDQYEISGSVEGPIAGEKLSGRFSFNYSDKEGHYENAIVDGQSLGDEESWSVDGVMLFEPTDRIRVRARAGYYEDRDGPSAVIRTAGFADHNFGGFPTAGGGTTETAFRGDIRTPRRAEIGLNTSQETFDLITNAALNDAQGRSPTFLDLDYGDLDGDGLLREGYRIGVDSSFDLTETLTLSVLTGYNEDEWLISNDFDSSPGFGFNIIGGSELKEFSFEARLAGSAMDDRLQWSIGGNYVDIEIMGTGGFFDGVLGFWFPGVFGPASETTAETLGFFGTLDYRFTDQWKVILELRSQEDEIGDPAVNANATTPISPETFDKILPRVLVQFEPTEDTLLYFNYSLGNLPGGFNDEVGELDATQLAEFNALVPGIGTSFDEEELENYEFGWKQSLMDGSMQFNLAAFYMERSDQIFSGFEVVSDASNVNGVRTVGFTANGATSDIYGAEFDITWLPTDNLTLQGSLGYVDAEIVSFPRGANSGDFTAVFGVDADVEGQVAPRFPEWQGSLSGTYEGTASFLNGGTWYTRADVFYTGEFFDENTNLAVIPDAWDVNLRFGIRMDNYTAELFVTNLFNEDAPIAGNNIADTGLDVRFGSGLFDFSQESVHVALRDKQQVGIRLTFNL